MDRSRLPALLVIVALTLLGWPHPPTPAQPPAKPDAQRQQAIEKTQKLLDEDEVDSKHFQKEMPLTQFLENLEKQLPRGKRVSLRIDKEAFGNRFAEVAGTPIRLPASPEKTTLRRALELAVAKSKVKADYRIGDGEVAVTTPERALYTAVYDIRYFVRKRKPESSIGPARDKIVHFRNAEPVKWAAFVAQNIIAVIDPESWQSATAHHGTIQILNGNHLEISASAARHAQIVELLEALHRLSDVSVIVKARLYEVDGAFYSKVKNAKRVRLDELERQALAGIPPRGDALWKLLEKQKVVLDGDEVKIDNHRGELCLSRHQVVSCLPNPDQIRKGVKNRQANLDGVSFLAGIQVSADRRSVRAKLTEKGAEIREIERVKVPVGREEEVDAESPLLEESGHSRMIDIPDGGTVLLPVHYRPASARKKDRWWVLAVNFRIVVAEEERLILDQSLEAILPGVLADVLTNPRLKGVRDFYATPGDKRFALVNSDVWTWPREFRPDVPGYQPAPVKREGQRLLGIRVDKHQKMGKDYDHLAIAVTLVNAGGSANGAVIGGCTLRYTAKHGEGGWKVELAEPSEP